MSEILLNLLIIIDNKNPIIEFRLVGFSLTTPMTILISFYCQFRVPRSSRLFPISKSFYNPTLFETTYLGGSQITLSTQGSLERSWELTTTVKRFYISPRPSRNIGFQTRSKSTLLVQVVSFPKRRRLEYDCCD